MSDIIIRATGTKIPLRFVLVSLKDTANEIGKKHNAKGFALKLLAETAVSSLLLSSGLKFPGTVCYRIDMSGELRFAQADSTPQGLVRAMIPQDDLQALGANEPLLNPQKLTVIQLNEKGMRARESIVEAASMQMGVNLAAYLQQSEQTKSAAAVMGTMGFLVEAYPDTEKRDLEIMDAVVRNLPPLDNFNDVHSLLDELRGPYSVEIVKEVTPQAYCPCSIERVLSSLSGLHSCEIKDILQKNETLDVVCDFCRTHYAVTPNELRSLI